MPALPKVLDHHAAARLLTRLKEEILKEWETQARKRVPAAKNQSRLALRDSLPQFLDQLNEKLECGDSEVQKKKGSEDAHQHAEERSDQPEYTLDQVIYEYRILRSVIIQSLESDEPVDSQSLSIIHEFIDNGIQASAVRYTELETKRQADQEEIKAARSEAERASEAKSAFLANMSHEIRTPLGAIMGFVGLLQDKGISSKDVANYLAIIDRNSHHLLRIIDDILDLTKVESGKMTMEKVEFPLVEFLADFASLIDIRARENGIVFEFRAETLLPEFVISDPTRLRQILSNVVGNAIKFTEKGRVELAVAFNGRRLDFRVSDTGRGISPEQRPKLFQAFAQADSSTTRKFGGTGLGLVLTKKLSQALGGDFDLVTSDIGKGSTFEASISVTLPSESKLIPLREVVIAPSSNPDTPQTNLKGFEVLVAEDSLDNQLLIQKILTKTGAKIALANDGLEGVKSALAHHYDVILMDIQMPNVDGHEAVRSLRAQGYTGPVVALTAHAMNEERERAIRSGFSHFLTKPIDRKSLLELLERIHSPLNLIGP